MSLLFADGFEDGTTAWVLNNLSLGAGRNGNGLLSTSAATGQGEVGFPPTAGPIIAGCAFKPIGAAAVAIMTFASAATFHVVIGRGGSGEINVYRQDSGNLLGSSAIGVVPAGAWSYIEARVTIHDTTGSVVVRVNGVEVLNLTNQDTKTSTVTTANLLRIGTAGASPISGAVNNAWDDVYLADTTGSFNNTFIGDVIVEHLRPTADDTAQWVGSDGNSIANYDLVDEAGVYNGADYVASATVGQRDLYTIGASPRPAASPVAAVMPVAVGMKTDAGTRSIKLNVKEGAGGTVRASADKGLPTSFGEISAVFDRKNDGTAWTVADVNALRIGYEVST